MSNGMQTIGTVVDWRGWGNQGQVSNETSPEPKGKP